MTRRFIVDSSAWVAYFGKKFAFKKLIEESELKTPAVVLAEVARVLEKRKISEEKANSILDYIIRTSVIVALETSQAINAGKLAAREGLSLADAIVYGHATNEENLLTGDEDFAGKPNVLLLKQS